MLPSTGRQCRHQLQVSGVRGGRIIKRQCCGLVAEYLLIRSVTIIHEGFSQYNGTRGCTLVGPKAIAKLSLCSCLEHALRLSVSLISVNLLRKRMQTESLVSRALSMVPFASSRCPVRHKMSTKTPNKGYSHRLPFHIFRWTSQRACHFFYALRIGIHMYQQFSKHAI